MANLLTRVSLLKQSQPKAIQECFTIICEGATPTPEEQARIAYANSVGGLVTHKIINHMGTSFWQLFKFVIAEGFALAITALVSNMTDSSQGVNFWIVFATITMIRWLNPNKVEKLQAKAKPRLLLVDMIGVYNLRLNTIDFNPKLILELLYDLERKGAVYSPWVYHLLDGMKSD
jgi:hypothetical protein